MLKPIEHIINIDLANKININKQINIKKNDTNSHKFIINLFDNSLAYDLTSTTQRIYFKKADGTTVFANCVIENISGKISYILDTQCVSFAGNVETEITIYGSAGEILTSITFVFEVRKIIRDDAAIESTSQFTALTTALNSIEEALVSVPTIEALKIALDGDIITGDALDITLKGDITTGNALDITLKGDITTGDALDITLKADISTGNVLDTSLKDDIATGNPLDISLKADISTGNPLDVALKEDISIGNPLDIALKEDISTGDITDAALKADIIIAGQNEFATEITSARKGEVDLGTKIGKLDSSLANMTSQIRESNAILDGTTDDTNVLQIFLNNMTKKEFLISNCTIKISGTLDIPNGINIRGNNATIILNGRLILNGNNKIENLIFEGQNLTNYNPIKLMGDNIDIKFNKFMNFKTSTTSMETNVIMTYGNNVHIENNLFDGIAPDSVSLIARAVKTFGSDEVYIKNNTFKNMVGYTDSDYVYITSVQIADTTFPFNEAPGITLNKIWTSKNVIVSENLFYQSCRSSIKLQCSGVRVHNNRIILTETDVLKLAWATIRAYSSKNLEILGNKIFVNVLDVTQLVHLQFCASCTISDNEITSMVNLSTTSTVNQAIFLEVVDNIKVINNKFNLKNFNICVYGNCLKRVSLINNHTVMENGGKILSMFFKTVSYYTPISDAISVKDNACWSDFASQQIYILNAINVLIKNNEFINNSASIVVSTATDIIFVENIFGKKGISTTYFVELTSCINVKFIRNIIESNLSYILRVNNPCTGICVYSNDLNGTLLAYGFYNITDNASQILIELKYAPGSIKLDRLDYGTTEFRPTIGLQIGHLYFDNVLHESLSWDLTNWRNGIGTIV